MQYFRYELYHRHHPETAGPLPAFERWFRAKKQGVIKAVTVGELYFIASEGRDCLNKVETAFCDPVLCTTIPPHYDMAVQITFRPGVTDNKGQAARQALQLIGVDAQVRSGRIFLISGDVSSSELSRAAHGLLANQLLEECQVYTRLEFEKLAREVEIIGPVSNQLSAKLVQQIDLTKSDQELLELSGKNCWALELTEIKVIQAQFRDEQYLSHRKSCGLPSNPTDVEMEILAQTWSEHCKHKIFSAKIHYCEGPDVGHALGTMEINSAFRTFIKGVSEDIIAERKIDWAVSLFKDNAGIVRFDKNIDICAKVETHNSPSALDPYGGALTGILGVNRDILGTGQGARPILNTDVFCVAQEKSSADEIDADAILLSELPKGLLAPKRILEGVHKGVEDGGNKSGIPTVGGAIYFHPSYAGKPLIYVGTVGVLPPEIKGRPSAKKEILPGDLIVMAGGRVGRDGVHGATMSSLELEESVPLSVVQIGDPITQKRLQDFLLEARDLELYRTLTDNGAGGLSSSVGEMAQLSGGAEIDVSKCPLKYQGLMPWEIIVSESQERMTFAVPEESWSAFHELSLKRGVEASVLGTFTHSGFFDVKVGTEIVASLPLSFLHEGLPPMDLKAYWNGGDALQSAFKWRSVQIPSAPMVDFKQTLQRLLSRPNIASKWPWITCYDHEVQGSTVIRPMGGMNGEAPHNAGGVWLHPHGGELQNGVLVSMGLNPRLALLDPYIMGVCAVDEAIRNAIVHGGNPDFTAILDNFCWPDPLQHARLESPGPGDQKLGMLVRTLTGLKDAARALGVPMISGKDSMKNDFKGRHEDGRDITISALPTLLITAISRFDVGRSISPALPGQGICLYLVGPLRGALSASEFAEVHGDSIRDENLLWQMLLNLKDVRAQYEAIHRAISEGVVVSAHDLSDGGLAVALAEMLLHSDDLGLECTLPDSIDANVLFGEGPFRILLGVPSEKRADFESRLHSAQYLGQTAPGHELKIHDQAGPVLLQMTVPEMRYFWQRSRA
ncbi:MAG: phosphoribosylformylglycinamidine synthase subunit PurS [Bdellovibrio sp.]|nr:phosphoribosylformylglycinamidine synthase subunit PurS [Bdellovibrio sp.]